MKGSLHLQTERDMDTWNGFAADPANRYVENVRPMMAALIKAEQVPALQRGAPMKDVLSEAYDMACQADPQIRLLIQKPAAPNTTQGGAPAGQQQQGRALTPAQQRASGSLAGAPLQGGRSLPANDRAADSELFDQIAGRA